MKITEGMVCGLCKGDISAADAVPYAVGVHGVPRLNADLSKGYDNEWLLHIGRGDVRTWQFTGNPMQASEGTAEYMGHHSQEDAMKKGTLKPGEMWNHSKILKSAVSEVNTGRVIIKSHREERVEVVELTAVSGALKGTITLTQSEPLSRKYNVTRIVKHPYSLHHHTWSGGNHYDIRVNRGPQIHEWVTETDPRGTLTDEPTLLKLCEDHTWMNFDGQRIVNDTLTKAELLDKGTVTILNESNRNVDMSFKGKMSFTLSLRREEDTWLTTGENQI